MLTRNASKTGKLKYFLSLPLLADAIIFCTSSKPGSEKKFDWDNHKIIYQGNVFDMTEETHELDTVTDANGKMTIYSRDSDPTRPATMNGKKIFESTELDVQPVYKGKHGDLSTEVFNLVERDMNTFPDGSYIFNLMFLIVDEHGRLVYTDGGGIYGLIPTDKAFIEKKTQLKHIENTIENYMARTDFYFQPGMKDGEPVLCHADNAFLHRTIIVKNHKASLQ